MVIAMMRRTLLVGLGLMATSAACSSRTPPPAPETRDAEPP
ncbi:MAG: hypothetical protein JWP87_3822, partial [Labilithrix sp.]|nr:hypothetical protein [Labilithrix sp.]